MRVTASDAPLVYVHVTMRENPNLALVQTGLRNAGFDQKLYVEEFNRYEGTISPNQLDNLLTVPHVEGIKVVREAWT